MSMTDFTEDAVLEHFFNNVDLASYATVWLGLFSAAPSDTGGGTELTGNGYARIDVSGNFTVGGVATRAGNTAAIEFQASGGDWSSATHFGVFSLVTAGTLLFWGALTTARQIDDGEKIVFEADDLGFTLA